MGISTISLEVDADAAKAYAAASSEDRRKLQWLLNLRLRELTTGRSRPLSVIMDEMGREAQAHGLTPELLESLLADE